MVLPKISIVTPNFNKGQFLEHTILSVLNQEYPHLEYIVIDGGSTDNSVEIIRRYEDRLAFWCSEPDGGMYDAIRKGFAHATGEILAWINSDDMYHPGALSIVASVFCSYPQVKWLTGYNTYYDEHGRTVSLWRSSYFSHLHFLMGNYKFIQQESTFWRRELYDRVGGISTQYRLAGDFHLWMRFSRTEKLYVIDSLTGGFRFCKGQLSENHELYDSEVKSIIADEECTDEERRQIRKCNFYQRVIDLVKFCKVLNWQGLEHFLMKDFFAESYSHHLVYDHSIQQYRIRDI